MDHEECMIRLMTSTDFLMTCNLIQVKGHFQLIRDHRAKARGGYSALQIPPNTLSSDVRAEGHLAYIGSRQAQPEGVAVQNLLSWKCQ